MKTDSNLSEDAQMKQPTCVNTVVHPGMYNVPDWLKYHRLHKYSSIIMTMTYQEMMNMKEETLISLGVTKGAARKLSKIILRLHERSQMLDEINSNMTKGGDVDVRRFLCDMEEIVRSPILLISEIRSTPTLLDQIVITLTNICSQLLLSPSTDGRTGNFCVSNNIFNFLF